MTNCYWGYTNHGVAGSIRAGSETTARPIANLQKRTGMPPWQTAGVTAAADGAWFEVDAGEDVTWRYVLLGATNLTAAATWRIMLGSTAGGSDAYDSGSISAGVIPGILQAVKDLGAEHTARYLRVEIDDATNPDGFLTAGLLYAGPVWQPPRNFVVGTEEKVDSGTTITRTRGGQEYPVIGWQQRRRAVSWELLDEADLYGDIAALERVARSGANVLLVPFPGAYEAQTALLGLLTTDGSSIPHTRRDLRTWRATITERL
jgi:hypothetical protein